MTEQNTPVPEDKTSFGDYDTDAPEDALPDFEAELTEEADEVFEDDEEGTA